MEALVGSGHFQLGELVGAFSEHCATSPSQRFVDSVLDNLGHGSWGAANHPAHLPEAAHDCPNNSNDKMGGSGRLML